MLTLQTWKPEYWVHRLAQNAFCPTGKDGGRDNSCSPKGGSTGSYKQKVASRLAKLEPQLQGLSEEQGKLMDRMTQKADELGGFDQAKGDPEYERLRGELNESYKARSPVQEELNRLRQEKKILDLPEVSNLPTVKVKPGVDVNPEVAKALVGGLLNREVLDDDSGNLLRTADTQAGDQVEARGAASEE